MREFDIASASAPQGQVQLVAQSMLREAWGHLRAEEWTQAERVLSAALFRAPSALDFEVAPAGDRFLVRSSTGANFPPIRLLTDWRAALRASR